jgi:four helix bundle protein
MHNFRKLTVWSKAIDFIVDIYKVCETFPNSEKYGISSQVQRAAVSISCNISEGCGKSSEKEFNRFLEIALSSAFEVENLLIVSQKLNFINKEKFSEMEIKIKDIQGMIIGLKKSINK